MNNLKENIFVYIGTNSGCVDKGLYACLFDSKNGLLTTPQLMATSLNPNFEAIHPSGNWLYSFNSLESSENRFVSAYSICKETGNLKLINQVSSEGQNPCHIVIDKTGQYALVSNYGSGNLAILPINKDGSLEQTIKTFQHSGSSIDKSRQEGPHIHSITIDKNNNYFFAIDLGLDKILSYRFDVENQIFESNKNMPFISVAGGVGPRHFVFSPCGNYGYVINEMGNTITAFKYNSYHGTLGEIQNVSTIPTDYNLTTYTSEIQIHSSGRYLYCSNRGHNSIAVFEIDSLNGKLTLIETQPCGGDWPRHFCIDPSGNWLLVGNERSSQITVFKINTKTGKLVKTDCLVSIPSPVCIKFSNNYKSL